MKKIKLLILLSIIFVACAQKQQIDYASSIPKPLVINDFIVEAQSKPQYEVEIDSSCGWEKTAVPSGILTTSSGTKIEIKAGVLISNCKAEQLVKYKSAAEMFYVQRNQIAIAYKAQYDGCVETEKYLQSKIYASENPSTWEKIDCDVCFAAGAGTCMGIVYGLAPAMKDK